MRFNSDTEAAKSLVEFYENLKNETAKVIVGQQDVIDKLLIALFTQIIFINRCSWIAKPCS